jgi:hypothetical protein
MKTFPPLPIPFMELNREIAPVVYEGWAAQMRAYGEACAKEELTACIKMLEEIHERRKNVDNLALYFANLLRDRL